MKKKIGEVAFLAHNKAILPKIGEKMNVVADDEKMTILLSGIKTYAITKESLKAQLKATDVKLQDEIMADIDFSKTILGEVKDIEEIEENQYAIILEVSEEISTNTAQKATKKQQKVEMEFRGGITGNAWPDGPGFPAKEEFIKLARANKPLGRDLMIAKSNDKIILFWGEDAVGEAVSVPAEVASKLKSFTEDQKFNVTYKSYSVGNIKIEVNPEDIKVDLNGVFDDIKDEIMKQAEMDEEEFNARVKILTEVYSLPVSLVRRIMKEWRPIHPDYSYGSIEEMVYVNPDGTYRPKFIDTDKDNEYPEGYIINSLVSILDGENLSLIGKTGVGKNILIDVFAGMMRRKLFKVSVNIGTDEAAIDGDRTVNEKSQIDFFRGPLMKAMEFPEEYGGAWILFDEINMMSTSYQSSLFSVLEQEHREKNVAFYKEVKATKGFRMLCTMNPNYKGTDELNSAFERRWEAKIEVKGLVPIKDIIMAKYPTAKKAEVDKLALIHNDIVRCYEESNGDMDDAFITPALFAEVVKPGAATEFTSFKTRCNKILGRAKSDDKVQTNIIMKCINDRLN